MSKPVIQTSFNAGEWAPALNARVDLAKYHSGAALLRNFFVDYRGGATTRPGTKYIASVINPGSAFPARLIPFQASSSIAYALEFGQNYIGFYFNGAPVVENATTINTISNANPGVVSDTAHGYSTLDRVLITGVGGMTQVNGQVYRITVIDVNRYTLKDIFGNVVDTTSFGTYTSGGTAQRVYIISSPYLSSEVFQIKYTQNVSTLILTHPNHPPYVLTLITATNWTLAAIVFGSTAPVPSPSATSTLGAGSVNYSYCVTAVDVTGQESAPGFGSATLAGLLDLRTTPGTNTISWIATANTASYNVYKAELRYGTPVPSGAQFGFIGNCTGVSFIDSNIAPDFATTPPVVQNPFSGSGVQNVTVNFSGNNYPAVPSVTFTAAPAGGSTATGFAVMTGIAFSIASAGSFYIVGDVINFAQGVVGQVASATPIIPGGGGSPGSGGNVTGITIINSGAVIGPGVALTNPLGQVTTTSARGTGFIMNANWAVISVSLTSAGAGYLVAPTITFSGSFGAVATATLGGASQGSGIAVGNSTVAGYFQQRLVLAGPVSNPQQFNMSQPGQYYNFNISNPPQADDAISGTLVSGQLNTIKSMIAMPTGLIVFSDRQAWLINGGFNAAPVSALATTANSQAYNGSSDLQPIVANYDILYVQAKGSVVRDLTYNFYTNIFTGSDISVLSSHLFYGYKIVQWAWAEEPFRLVWAVRSDGALLSLTFLKEQEMLAWSHHDTGFGTFRSICTITESTPTGTVDAIYVIVQRQINGQAMNYVERLVELPQPTSYRFSWQVDAGIQYSGAAASTFSGAQHLAGMPVTGLADGVVINFTMPTSGTFVFGNGGTAGLTNIAPSSVVTVGLAFTPQIQTLALDLGEPTVQGKRKKVSAVTVRVANALGLYAGKTLTTTQPIKDLIIGQTGTMSNAPVTDLQTTDCRLYIDPAWDVFGQYFITQPNPYPASVLGVIPEIEIGDDP
jgi:hypothetical protein